LCFWVLQIGGVVLLGVALLSFVFCRLGGLDGLVFSLFGFFEFEFGVVVLLVVGG
jgi:hypothetical protein